MGILKRIKNRLPIVGGQDTSARPADSHGSGPSPQRPPPPPPKTAEEVRAEIEAMVAEHKVVVFMKGTARAPQCGFSAAAAAALGETGFPFESVNVLADPAVRQGIKEFSDWPTIPQVYIGGEFVGGSDIVREMAASGELKEAVEAAFAAE